MTTERKIGETTFTLVGDRELVATRVFDAPRRIVWEAWTRPEHISRWLLGPEGWTMPVCEVDLRVGGRWRYEWAKPGEPSFGMEGEYLEIVPPERLVHTERWGADAPAAVNTVLFSEANGRTTVTHKVVFPSAEAREGALATGMLDGWAESLDRLQDQLLPAMDAAKA
jgi:uncharacterized protein YndB with AHSA1/START domain